MERNWATIAEESAAERATQPEFWRREGHFESFFQLCPGVWAHPELISPAEKPASPPSRAVVSWELIRLGAHSHQQMFAGGAQVTLAQLLVQDLAQKKLGIFATECSDSAAFRSLGRSIRSSDAALSPKPKLQRRHARDLAGHAGHRQWDSCILLTKEPGLESRRLWVRSRHGMEDAAGSRTASTGRQSKSSRCQQVAGCYQLAGSCEASHKTGHVALDNGSEEARSQDKGVIIAARMKNEKEID